MAGCRVCGGTEEGLGLSALWSILTCSSREAGAGEEEADDGINYSRISRRYDLVFEDRRKSYLGRPGEEESPLHAQGVLLTAKAMHWDALPKVNTHDMVTKFIEKIEKQPLISNHQHEAYTPTVPLSDEEAARMKTALLTWQSYNGGTVTLRQPLISNHQHEAYTPTVPLSDEEAARMKTALLTWQSYNGGTVTLRQLFNLYVVMDRIFKPVFEDKMTSLAGWSSTSPPRWNGESLTIHELLSDLWAGHVLLYGELTPNHTNIAPVLFDLTHFFGAVEEVGLDGKVVTRAKPSAVSTDREAAPASGAGAAAARETDGPAAAAGREASDAPGGDAPDMTRPPERFRWTADFRLAYRTIVWLLREQVSPWDERRSASWYNPEILADAPSSSRPA